MPDYHFKVVDAFTTRRFAGNPCGVVTRAEGLDEATMQAIARELNLSETAFVFPSGRASYRVRFFTPRKEIPLAGHPTIATAHALVEEGRIDISQGTRHVTQELGIGVLPVDVGLDDERNVRVVMTQAKPAFGKLVDRAQMAAALGIDAGDIRDDAPVQVVSTGTPQAMAPVRSLDVLRRVRPDYGRLAEIEEGAECFGTHVFALEAIEPPNRTHARHFTAGGGAFEDPVTGSATGGMAAYLWKHGLLREARYRVEQGHLVGRPGHVDVEVEAKGGEPVAVRIAGTAVTALRGTIWI